MRLPAWEILGILALLLITTPATAKKVKPHQCPIGFKLAYTIEDRDPVCYYLKDTPEPVQDKFKGCTGNIFTSELYHSLNFTKTKHVIWTDFRSTYPGGPYVDKFTSPGKLSLDSFDVKYDLSLGIDEELCVVIDPVSNFTAVSCSEDEKHYRYCFVKPYSSDRTSKGCKHFVNSTRFFSPLPTCLTAISGAGGGGLRATFNQALEMCFKRGGTLINKGWRLSNSPLFNIAESRSIYPFPLGVVMLSNGTLESIDSEDDKSVIPDSEWHFHRLSWSSDAHFGAIANDSWELVDSSYIFYNVICERTVDLENIKLELTIDRFNELILKVNNTIKKNDIRCFTDSLSYFPVPIKIDGDDDDDYKFYVSPDAFDGYYWCMQKDYKTYHPSDTNKTLWVKRTAETQYLYACKIRLSTNYRIDYIDSLLRFWKEKLERFIFYRTLFIDTYGDSENITEDMLVSFKKKKELKWTETKVIVKATVKRIYVDSRTVLLHLDLHPEMKPLLPGTRISLDSKADTLEVISMRPAYFCKGFESVPNKELGATVTVGCSLFTCVGDYNEGVQWVETAIDGCIPPPTRAPKTRTTTIEFSEVNLFMPTALPVPETTTDSNSGLTQSTTESIRITSCLPIEIVPDPDWSLTTTQAPLEISTVDTTETITVEPTEPPATTPRPPQEQLDDVIMELGNLLQNSTVPFESIERPFEQVNEILGIEDEELNISSELLQMLDALASRVSLGTEQRAIKVRDNLAFMMADATPENPIRGVRVAAAGDARASDVFTNRTFDFIEGDINASELLSSASEAVVYLPESVTREPRRISFVAFRNQRAFPSTYVVNSRVFSVNVENLTQFERGEVIDIHLTPLVGTPERDQRRVCAYWHFENNGSGYWARDGCRLIRASRPGAMDTCRCDHLTHFAEVLVPRTVFSERNERALEILSVVGCCLSILGLLAIGATAALFRSWRRDYSNKIWLQLCVAIFLMSVCFLVVVYADFERYDVPCMLVGVVLHYSVVASFCWMLVAAILSYRRLVLVFTRDMSHKLLRAAAFAWGAPCAVVGILLAVNPDSYAGRFEQLEPVRTFCYPTGLSLWLAVYTPIALMLLANWTLFILIVRSVFASRRIQRHGDSNEALRCASVSCLLVFLFGLPWIFGLFASNVVLAYLFNLTANFQGFVLFVFFVVGNKKTRDLWLNKLKIKQTRKVPVTSSTYTNRSVGPGWRAGTEGGSSIEAKTSKPRSLTSPDDSRFS